MRNTLAIAQKELRSYFTSPIGYIVIGLFALLYGYFYVADAQLLRPPEHAGGQFGGPQAMNVNQMMIRPLLQNVTILLLFVMPMITMRTYAEEKRSGTIELLLTSPLSDVEIILGKFLGALLLWCVMLGVSLLHLALLFAYGRPEWKPHRDSLSRPVPDGRLFHFGRALHLEPDQESDRGRRRDVRGVPASLDHHWIGSFSGPTVDKVTQYLSIVDQFDDFAKGVIDTSHLIYYVSFIGFGLFLTAKSVDSERWRG